MIACLKLLSHNSRRQCMWKERKSLGIMDNLAELRLVCFWNTQNLNIIDAPTSIVCFPFWGMAIIKPASAYTLILCNYNWKILSALSFVSLWLGPWTPSCNSVIWWLQIDISCSLTFYFCAGAWYEWSFIVLFSVRPHGAGFRFSRSFVFTSLIVSSSETYQQVAFMYLYSVLRGLSPRANYTDRAAAAGRRS